MVIERKVAEAQRRKKAGIVKSVHSSSPFCVFASLRLCVQMKILERFPDGFATSGQDKQYRDREGADPRWHQRIRSLPVAVL